MLARFDDKIHLGSPHPEPRRRGYESNSHTITKIGQKTDLCYGGSRGTRTPDPLGVNEML